MNFKLLTLVLLLLMSACVGTIKDKSKKASTSVAATAKVSFDGVIDGGTISHNKLWVRFKPATGGSGVFSYHAFLDGLTIAHTSLNAENARVDDQGFIVMAISDLKKFTAYRVSIKVYDAAYSLYDDNIALTTVWTADDYLPVFDGISSLENVNGIDAMTSLNIRWNTSTSDPSAPFDAAYSVSGYSVYYSTDEGELWGILREENPYSIDYSKYPHSAYKSVTDPSANEASITGLTPGATYYVAVRARDSYSTPHYERNFTIKSLDTYTHQPIEFAGLTSASVPVTQAGFSQTSLSWISCSACDVYKVYAKPASVDNGSVHPGTDNAYLIGTLSDLSLTSSIFGGLTKNTDYKVYMLACIDMTCGWDGTNLDERDVKGRFSSQSITTTPPIAPYSTEPDTPTQPAGEIGLTSLDINFELDVTSGYFSKVRVYQILDKEGDLSNYSGGNFRLLSRSVDANLPYIDPTISSSPLNYATNPRSVRIANLEMGQEYCFQILPFIEYPDLTFEGLETTLPLARRPPVVCGTPSYVPPDFGATSFFPTCSNVTATSVTITWTHPPTANVISSYEVYSKEGAGAFTFDGVDGAWNNHDTGDDYILQEMVLLNTNSLTISDLIPNTTYAFGVNTYYKPGPTAEPIRAIPSDAAASVYCTTELPDVGHSGWRDVIAIGPKINGLSYNQFIASGNDAETARANSIIPEFLLPDLKIPYEWDEKDSLTVAPESSYTIGDGGGNVPAASTSGAVYLQWSDFKVQGTDSTISNYYRDGMTGLGYKVYRVALEDIPPTGRPGDDDTNWSDDIRNANSDYWTLATNLRFDTRSYDMSTTLPDEEAEHFISYSSEDINDDTNNPNLISASGQRQQNGDIVYELIDYPPQNGKTYIYKIVGVFGGVEAAFSSSKRINTITVISPPDNMALVHRWIANQQVCGSMQRGSTNATNCKSNGLDGNACCNSSNEEKCSDETRSYRCEYNGLASTVDLDDNGEIDVPQVWSTNANTYTRYYDIGHSTLVDRFEMGCNFTRGTSCNGGDCIDQINSTVSPSAVNNVKLTRSSYTSTSHHQCYISLDGSSWKMVQSLGPDVLKPLSNIAGSNNAYLAPLSGRSQEAAHVLCQGQNLTLEGATYTKRLANRKEAVVFTKRHDQHVNLAKDNISSQRCLLGKYQLNNQYPIGVAPDYNSNTYNLYSISMSNRSIVTGSRPSGGNYSTALCSSHYGLQDAHGNAGEYLMEKIHCEHTADATSIEFCTTDPANYTVLDDGTANNESTTINLVNGDGSYYFFDRTGHSMGASPEEMIWSNSLCYSYSSPFINTAMGLSFSCQGASCHSAGGLYTDQDDNTLITYSYSSATYPWTTIDRQSPILIDDTTNEQHYLSTLRYGNSLSTDSVFPNGLALTIDNDVWVYSSGYGGPYSATIVNEQGNEAYGLQFAPRCATAISEL